MAEVYEIYVDSPQLVMKAGELLVNRGQSPMALPWFQFTYDQDYLADARAFALSPDLPLLRDVFRDRAHDREMLGAFADAMPDKWGRRLIERRYAQTQLHDVDYLLNVPDFTRQGAIRIRQATSQEFLGANFIYGGTDGLTAIHQSIQRFESGTCSEADLEQLLLTGSQSNGGQFPKTALLDQDGDLCIAKFPGNSELASPHWEAVCLDMARAAGIEVPQFEHHWLGDLSVLIEKRFDRIRSGTAAEKAATAAAGTNQTGHDLSGNRLPYISAESFMQLPSNPTFITPYAIFARQLQRQLGSRQAQLLFARVAFLLMVNNTDDHWKNHGLLFEDGQWHLAPLFDINPTTRPDPYDLPQLTNHIENKRSLATLLDDSASYALSRKAAQQILEDTAEVVRNWRNFAQKYLRTEAEIEQQAASFQAACKLTF
ncbi:MAG: type II toxin-antitoxin system HipA family toxin [Coriobacteriales bacterium]|jgi:serine/threonine-protein kinase HipA|nr:type II toxin-antitoxin system HipA family toxin [Coriobacteriales bacterium]